MAITMNIVSTRGFIHLHLRRNAKKLKPKTTEKSFFNHKFLSVCKHKKCSRVELSFCSHDYELSFSASYLKIISFIFDHENLQLHRSNFSVFSLFLKCCAFSLSLTQSMVCRDKKLLLHKSSVVKVEQFMSESNK